MIRALQDRIGWKCGCVIGYPVKHWHRWKITHWIADRWDPWERPEFENGWGNVETVASDRSLKHTPLWALNYMRRSR